MRVHWCFLAALVVSTALGFLTPGQALAGFVNAGVLAIGCLYVVAAGVRRSGALDRLLEAMLAERRRPGFLPWVAAVSSVVNNTPVVGLLLHPLQSWCRRHSVSPSKLLLPLSYAATFGGMLTLFGTSTNLVVNGLLVESGFPQLGVFEVSKVGLPCALVGVLFLVTASRHLLPPRDGEALVAEEQARPQAAIMWPAVVLLVAMVALTTLSKLPILASTGLAAAGMVLVGCCTLREAWRAIDWRVLLLLASALGLARAAQNSGLPQWIVGHSPLGRSGSTVLTLVTLYLVTWLLTEFLTNAAAAALVFPVVLSVAEQQHLQVVPLALLVMVAASSTFVTPYGNQTNLMVWRPGGYHLRDYLVMGLPLALITGVTAVGATWGWLFWGKSVN